MKTENGLESTCRRRKAYCQRAIKSKFEKEENSFPNKKENLYTGNTKICFQL